MTVPEQQTSEKAQTCYRHPDRETWVSCGRCGKPLCPDCMRHGPVGVRCVECLRPAGERASETMHAPQRVGLALGIALGMALVWLILLLVTGMLTGIMAPNLLISGIAGGAVGGVIWRIVGRTWNARTVRWAVGIGVAVPALASLALLLINLLLHTIIPSALWIVTARIVVACAIGGFFAWLFATQRRGPTIR